jgi:CubicO group peptidase (beta-lactamase class C family)
MGSVFSGFGRFVRRRMKDWNVPGCAVGVVKGSRIIHAKAYGLRDVGRAAPVTAKTKFYTASFGKTFTATLAAILVEEGKLDWDTPVRDYLPSLRMYDPVATERATIRDFLAQRTGLGRHGRLWVNSALTRADILERLRYLEPCRDFRSTFIYSNINYIVAGAVMEYVAGESYEDLVRSRILERTRMQSSLFVTDDLSGEADIAAGYELDGDRLLPFFRSFRRNWSLAGLNGPCAPAGAILSDIGDMCQYVRLHMHAGKLGNRRIVAERYLRETHTPHMLWPGLGNGKELLEAFYGMGWLVQPYRGRRLVWCGGNAYGFGVRVGFLPRQSVGIAVMTNQVGTRMTKVLLCNLSDRILGLDQIPWNRRELRLAERLRSHNEVGKVGERRGPRTPPSRPLQDYAGEYAHPGYDTVRVTVQNDRLRLEHNRFPFRVRHLKGDIFSISVPTGYDSTASFKLDDSGEIASVAIPFAPDVKEIVFEKIGR